MTKEQQARQKRLSGFIKPVKNKFKLTNKEIQIVHVAAIHLNIWLLDQLEDYPEVEKLYQSIRSVSVSFYTTWDDEIKYAQKNLNKLASKLHRRVHHLKIEGQYNEIEWVSDNIEHIEVKTDKAKIIEVIDKENDKKGYVIRRLCTEDIDFDIEVQYIEPAINPLVFGLGLIMYLIEQVEAIDLKLRMSWQKQANAIYDDVEKAIGNKDYGFRNSNLLTKLYAG